MLVNPQVDRYESKCISLHKDFHRRPSPPPTQLTTQCCSRMLLDAFGCLRREMRVPKPYEKS